MKRNCILSALLVVLLFTALLDSCGGGHAPRGQAQLRDLTSQNVAEVKDEFNAAKDDVRLLLLLSPT